LTGFSVLSSFTSGRSRLAALVIGLLAAPVVAHAAWENTDWATVFQPLAWTDQAESASDDMGGMLVIMYDPGEPLAKVSVSRLDHTGNKLWGDHGVKLPSLPGSTGMGGPVAIRGDGTGGAYCLSTRHDGSARTLMLTRLDAAGSRLWALPVGDYGTHPLPAASLHKSLDGDLLVAWNRTTGTVDEELVVQRLTAAGATIWQTIIFPDTNNLLDDLTWLARPDGLGGLVVRVEYQPGGVPQPLQSRDDRDDSGRVLPSGIYFSRLQLPGGEKEAVTKTTML
jgi:hypothetical protein